MRSAGVLPAFEALKHEVVEIEGRRFIRLSFPEGTTEVVVQQTER